MDAEKAHHLTMKLFSCLVAIPVVKQILKAIFSVQVDGEEQTIMGLRFKNPIGLAAGFDKDGKYLEALEILGFGFIEVGTITPLPQIGNPKPRLFRLVDDDAIINRMGFNNEGVDKLVTRLKKLPQDRGYVLGGNIGKNKDTPNEIAYQDYLVCFEKLYPYVDYFVVNLSSPNTPGLRELQNKEPLTKLLSQLSNARSKNQYIKPILVKVSPDLNQEQLQDVIHIVEFLDLEGIICTNTTISRDNLKSDRKLIITIGNGGLSGQPICQKSTDILSMARKLISKDKVLIGVGGVASVESAIDKINAGADLVQIYSGFIYKGPFLVKRLVKGLWRNHNNSLT